MHNPRARGDGTGEPGHVRRALRATDQGRASLPRTAGDQVELGQHMHLKLHHERFSTVLLPLRPGDPLSFVAVKQIAAALAITPEELTVAVRTD